MPKPVMSYTDLFDQSRWYSLKEVRALREEHHLGGDSISDKETLDAIWHGRPAFWSLHTYHQALFVHEAALVNGEDGIGYAARRLLNSDIGMRYEPVSFYNAFLARLLPANPEAARLLSTIRSLVGTTPENASRFDAQRVTFAAECDQRQEMGR